MQALSSGMGDFEDAVMAETAKRIGACCIVTRNTRDYTSCGVPVCTPGEFLERLASIVE